MYLTEKNWMHRWHPNKKHFLSCDSSPPDGDSTRDLIRCTGLPPRRPGPHPRRHPLFLSAAWRLMKGTLGCRASTQLYSVLFIIRPLRHMSTVNQAFLFLFQHFLRTFSFRRILLLVFYGHRFSRRRKDTKHSLSVSNLVIPNRLC